MENIFKLRSNLKRNRKGIIGIVAVMNVFLAIIALLKDMLLASYLGTSDLADAFVLAFFITDIIGNNLLGNAAATSSIPMLSKLYIKQDFKKLWSVFITMNLAMLTISTIVGGVFYLNSKSIIGFLGYGFTGDVRSSSTGLTNILFFTIILYPIVYTAISALQIKGKFVIAALVPILFNSIFLIGILLCIILKIDQGIGVIFISYSIIIAVVVIMGFTYVMLIKDKEFNLPLLCLKQIGENIPEVLRSLKLFFNYLIILFLSQGVLYIERYLTSQFGVGSVAAQSYAFRLSQFPVWVFTSAISTVTFPMMAKAKGKGDQDEVDHIFKMSIYITLLVTIPFVIILFLLREPIISVLFQRGAFTYKSLEITGNILATYTLAILTQSLNLLFIKYYFTEDKLNIPIGVLLISTIINSLVDIILIKKLGLMALGIGAAVSGLISLFIFSSHIKLGIFKNMKDKFNVIFKIAVLNGIILALSICFSNLWKGYFIESSGFMKFLYVVVVSSTCIGTYLWGICKWKLIK